jgi:hypothetical protein
MSVFKATFSRALRVSVSPNCEIPFPNAIVSGVNDTVSNDRLIDTTVDFIKLNVKAGDIVYNNSTGEGATVIKVSNSVALNLNADIFSSTGYNYTVYQASPQTGLGNTGCYLYIGESDNNYEVVTIGGDIVTFPKPQVGTVLPVQVKQVLAGGQCVALW